MTHQKTYHAWEALFARCYNPKNKYFHRYGGRGIKVCKRWKKYKNFLEDMGEAPIGLSIDRINNNKGYFKNNCRWANQKQQVLNSSRTRVVEYKGIKMSLRELAEKLGFGHSAFSGRLQRGWTIKEIIKYKKHYRRNFPAKSYLTYKGKTKTIIEWSKHLGINYHAIKNRLIKKWPLDMVLSKKNFKKKRYLKQINAYKEKIK